MNFEKVNLNVTYLCFHQVIVFQAYKNNSSSPIEAKYVFPLDDMAAGMFLFTQAALLKHLYNYNYLFYLNCQGKASSKLRSCIRP